MALKRVRAEPAVAPPEGEAARKREKRRLRRHSRARGTGKLARKNLRPPLTLQSAKTSARLIEAPLPQASSVANFPRSVPCPNGARQRQPKLSPASKAGFPSAWPANAALICLFRAEANENPSRPILRKTPTPIPPFPEKSPRSSEKKAPCSRQSVPESAHSARIRGRPHPVLRAVWPPDFSSAPGFDIL